MIQSKPLYEVRGISDLKDMITQSVHLFSNRPAFKIKNQVGEYDIITYSDYFNDINSLGTKLVDMGLHGKKIAIISENRYEWCVSYLAVVNGTGIAVPLDRSLPENEIENLLKRSEAECVIFSKKYEEVMKKIKENNTVLKHFIVMNDSETSDFLYLYDLISEGKSLLEKGNKKFVNAKIDNNDVAVIIFTSGTTSASKAVMLSHKNICSNIVATSSIAKVVPNDVALSFLPLHHTYECTLGFLTILYNGASIVHCDGLRYIVQNLNESHATIMVCVPLLFENIHKKILEQAKKTGKLKQLQIAIKLNNILKKIGIDMSRILFKSVHKSLGGKIRLFICGAAAIDTQVARDFNDMGIELLQGYGLTETSPLLAGNTDKDIDVTSTGRPIPGVEIDIINKDEDGIGEIIAKGPNIMLGYYNNKEATDEVLIDGWFHTGDLGMINERGNLKITGRKKNVIVLKNGKNVFPEELEGLLNKDEFIKESLVWGEEKEDGDVTVNAKIVPNMENIKRKFGNLTDSQLNEKIKEIIKNVNHKLSSYKAIKKFEISFDEFVKTTTQKVKRFEELKKNKRQ